MGYLLGIDIGSSSVKASLLDSKTGKCAGDAHYPKTEQIIESPEPGFAEQDPQCWYDTAKQSIADAMAEAGAEPEDIKAIGIAYQMHGLVCVDKNQDVLRPAIIWCDSRAVPYGEAAFKTLGAEPCLSHLMNSPGNFTAAKLAWVKEHQPDIYKKIDKIMLPGDWMAMKLTGKTSTTASGLSEGMFWDFQEEAPAKFLMDYWGFNENLLAEIVPTFGIQGTVSAEAAADLGLAEGTPVAYRGGDQPNNALSLNVLNPGEIAATAGTSGVVYGVTEQKKYDPQSRVNTFAHVNHSAEKPRLGVLLCINGTSSFIAWLKRTLDNISYKEMDEIIEDIPIGSEGLIALPFGNGAERVLGNREIGAQFANIDFKRHTRAHMCRALQEGVVFSFIYGMEVMEQAGIELKTIRAGFANMFMSDVFCETLAGVSGATIELYKTDGALGAARGAGYGAGIFLSLEEAFANLELKKRIEPAEGPYKEAYAAWKAHLETVLN
ncbi:xylulokinase [Pontiella agarivorans]|uniref:FGGY family carbohydrate kinase n=1 Tax=Pontiella agarivorans TaxID=3038953 RepID=A0ABU5MWJ5_9BACT|nr:FGGY family carbohydrate kinase [Pontiella agarivorans]MDZ8118594.1 FGGY family carbohydrate kinase [Pontiella agarivorans]